MTSSSIGIPSLLTVNDFRVSVFLGCEAEERQVRQEVRFDVVFAFSHPPQGCLSDRLDQTICYSAVCNAIRNEAEGKEYLLIEKLGWDVHEAVQRLLPTGAEFGLRVMKLRPPVPNLFGGASFYIGSNLFSLRE
jgi:dihydroneopterin aldolase